MEGFRNSPKASLTLALPKGNNWVACSQDSHVQVNEHVKCLRLLRRAMLSGYSRILTSKSCQGVSAQAQQMWSSTQPLSPAIGLSALKRIQGSADPLPLQQGEGETVHALVAEGSFLLFLGVVRAQFIIKCVLKQLETRSHS